MGGTLQSNLDLAIFYTGDNSTKENELGPSQDMSSDVDKELGRDQVGAFHRRLTQLNLAHFTLDSISNNLLPIKPIENIDIGAYAVVNSVEQNGRLLARKSTALLSCDLEAYLAQHVEATEPATGYHKLIWKWLRCPANALAFVHSKSVRHKDIKTRNILVKDFEVIFADFGSSHAFLDEGTKVTEGPTFGHTLMYCAPEVVSWEKCSRSADIFSLGCVYTEMALYLDVILPMSATNPEPSPTASSTSDTIQACFKSYTGDYMTTCSKRYYMQWD
ncbi:kinase-like protein [Zopfia rhizophila CBS 207.26]|uniref:Kinase-like protein n=1 Tax=Zopfia rhizophila CBS 207.26 TaxID=1314779 RepID=A0A6A6EQ81_9PEZI|nr:kinase-like protein [Zopfia rhizophila CBS 207.26]